MNEKRIAEETAKVLAVFPNYEAECRTPEFRAWQAELRRVASLAGSYFAEDAIELLQRFRSRHDAV